MFVFSTSCLQVCLWVFPALANSSLILFTLIVLVCVNLWLILFTLVVLVCVIFCFIIIFNSSPLSYGWQTIYSWLLFVKSSWKNIIGAHVPQKIRWDAVPDRSDTYLVYLQLNSSVKTLVRSMSAIFCIVAKHTSTRMQLISSLRVEFDWLLIVFYLQF